MLGTIKLQGINKISTISDIQVIYLILKICYLEGHLTYEVIGCIQYVHSISALTYRKFSL